MQSAASVVKVQTLFSPLVEEFPLPLFRCRKSNTSTPLTNGQLQPWPAAVL